MKIAFFEVSKDEQEIFKNLLGNNGDVLFFDEKLTNGNVSKVKDANIISVFINSPVGKDIIDNFSDLKLITTRSTGFDHIDLKYAESKGIKVSNVPAYGSYTVAEFTFALILSLSRKIPDAYNYLKKGGDFNVLSPLKGFDLHEKTIGVIGTGKIGKNVIKIAKGFGMKVLAYDLYPDQAFAQENNFEYKNLSEIMPLADILTLHVPYCKENYHIINKENISQMKKGMFVVNTARGELIDTDALIWGLKEGIIAGAGLDVLEEERALKEEFNTLSNLSRIEKINNYKTLLEDHVLIDRPNVIVTPHAAFYSKEAVGEIIKTTAENIKGYLENNPINLIK